eukprot:159165_1
MDEEKESLLIKIMCQHKRDFVDTNSSLDIVQFMDKFGFVDFLNEFNDHLEKERVNAFYLESVYNKLIEKLNNNKCVVATCRCILRNSRDKSLWNSTNNKSQDQNAMMYESVLDNVHVHLFHTNDMGYRLFRKETEQLLCDTDGELKQQELVKKKYMKYNESIKANVKHDKFATILTTQLFRDSFTQYLRSTTAAADSGIINKFNHWLYEQEYDTDALKFDFKYIDEYSSNIRNQMYKEQWNAALKFMDCNDPKEVLYSFGYRFYYWEFFKNNENERNVIRIKGYKTKADEKRKWYDKGNKGYKCKQWYIPEKYENIKQEILGNKLFCLSTYEFNVAMAKANNYIDVHLVKQMRSPSPDHLHFNIRPGTRLKISNLLSVFLYTDFSDLSKEFSTTFRKLQSYESLSSVKIRNAEFAQWARILRETVEYYGQDGYSEYFDGKRGRKRFRTLKGPFYSGMQVIMAIPEFNIRLYGPTSTSRQIEVAERFKGDSGIIMQFNNVGERASIELFGLDCSWLSNYNGEDEVLFFGGLRRIKIETLIVARVGEVLNYKRFFKALYIFDCMIGGTSWANDHLPHIKKGDRDILDNLINHKLDEQDFKNNYHEYINTTFDAFCNNKTTIGINIPQISSLKMMMNLILEVDFSDDENLIHTAMLKLEMLKIFKNVNHVIVYTTDGAGRRCFKVDIMRLVDELEKYIVNDFKITFKANEFVDNFSQCPSSMCSWLSTFCDSSKQNTDIGRELDEKDWHIALETKKLKNEERKEDNVTISKIDRKNNMFLKEWNIRNCWKIGDHIKVYNGFIHAWNSTKITAIDGDRIFFESTKILIYSYGTKESFDIRNKALRYSPDIKPAEM